MVKEKKPKIKSISKANERKGKQFVVSDGPQSERRTVKEDEFIEKASEQIGKGSLEEAKKKEEEINLRRNLQPPSVGDRMREKGSLSKAFIPQEEIKPELPEPQGFEKFLVGDIGGKEIDLRQKVEGDIGGKEFTQAELLGTAATVATLGIGGEAIAAAQATQKAATISRLATVTGAKPSVIAKVVGKAGTPTKIIGGLTAASIAKTGFKVAGTVAGADVLVTWYALDNVITGQKFFIKDVLSGLESGAITPEEALKTLKDSKETRETAINLVNQSAILNPLLWPFRELIMTGVSADEETIAFLEYRIEQIAAQRGMEQRELEKRNAIKRIQGITPAGEGSK